jgi:glutathione S-transferase
MNRDPLILHHYPGSPFAEKIRRILAFKALPWTSVRAPAVLPKPELVALTGGYRKVPVLQVGNHVYCDTALIARVIEERCPSPTLYQPPMAAALATWADDQLFNAALPYVLRPSRLDDMLRWFTQDELTRFADDRRDMGKDSTRPATSGKQRRAHFSVFLTWLESTLEHSKYLTGESLSIADFAAYHTLWVLAHSTPEALAGHQRVREFVAALEALPDPLISSLSPEEALVVSKHSAIDWEPASVFSDATGLTVGQTVVARAADVGRDPVQGTLVWAAADEVVLRREDPRAGVVYVHFPRLGYDIAAV